MNWDVMNGLAGGGLAAIIGGWALLYYIGRALEKRRDS